MRGECRDINKIKYVADEFGFITIDEDGKTVDIFKVIQSESIPIKVASCKIMETAESYITISSLQPTSYRDLDIHISKEYRQSMDSVIVMVKIPESEADENYIMLDHSVESKLRHSFSSEGFVEFHLKKYDFEFDNYFSLIIFPKLNPFESASSWGDSESLSFIDLRLDDALDMTDRDIYKIEIHIPNYSKDIFREWVILNDFILKDGSDIIWRNILFINSM